MESNESNYSNHKESNKTSLNENWIENEHEHNPKSDKFNLEHKKKGEVKVNKQIEFSPTSTFLPLSYNYEEEENQQFTNLLPMQPIGENIADNNSTEFIESSVMTVNQNLNFKEELVISNSKVPVSTEMACEFSTGSHQETESLYIMERDSDHNASELKVKASDSFKTKHSQEEEIISQLYADKISFSQVADLMGDDNEELEADLEDSSAEDEEDHAEAFEKELTEQQKYHLRRRGGNDKRRRRRLPAVLQGLMGEANLNYVRQEYDDAIRMCMEIIRQHSSSYEPYQTLGMIYEEKKLKDKSLQFLLIAAFLSPNAEEWEKLAELSLTQLTDLKQAVFCYGRAIRANPYNLDNHLTRCNLLMTLGEKTKALKGYIHTVKFLRPDQGEDGLKLAKEIAKIHFENGDIHLAHDAMDTAFQKYPAYVTPADTNLMLEVLMQMERYASCITVLIEYMKVQLASKNISENAFQKLNKMEKIELATDCMIPCELPSELRAKLAIAFIHLKKLTLADPLVSMITNEPIESFGDLYLEISEAYAKTDSHIHALPLLKSLLATEAYDVAAVWLLYGECLAASSLLDEAAEAYGKVVKLVPQHGDARLTLSSLLQKLHRTDEALHILHQEPNADTLNSSLLFQKCKILLNQNEIDEYLKTAQLIFFRHFVYIRSQDEAESLLGIKKLSNKYEALRELRKNKKENIDDDKPEYVGDDVPLEHQWELFIKVCQILYEQLRYTELERLTFSALGSKEFMRDKDKAKEIEFLCLIACMRNESYYFAYNIVREYIIKNQENNRCWNLLCFIISKADDFRHNKFLLRLTDKNPESVPLMMLNGHNCLVAGTYKFSLAEYTAAFKHDSSNPLIPLMLGLIFTHMACQKFSGKKHSLVVQACAFLNTYLELRRECQESFYNFGRAMHQLNLLPQAIHYYKKALEMPRPPIDKEGPDLDLSKEIAFNLHLIYRQSGNLDLARLYINKYIRI